MAKSESLMSLIFIYNIYRQKNMKHHQTQQQTWVASGVGFNCLCCKASPVAKAVPGSGSAVELAGWPCSCENTRKANDIMLTSIITSWGSKLNQKYHVVQRKGNWYSFLPLLWIFSNIIQDCWPSTLANSVQQLQTCGSMMLQTSWTYVTLEKNTLPD